MNNLYFPHDFNARHDPKIIKLQIKYGYEGIGIFWSLVEMIYEQNGYLQLDYNGIAFALQTDKNRIQDIIENYDLFLIKDEKITSKEILKRLKKIKDKSKIAQENAYKRWGKKEVTNNANALPLQCKRNAIKVNKSKVNKSKENNNNTNGKPLDFIDELFKVFSDCYLDIRRYEFETTTMQKERKGLGKLLAQYKKKKKSDKETTLKDFEAFFRQVLKIDNKWHFERMSPMHIASNLNAIKTILQGVRDGRQTIQRIDNDKFEGFD